MAELMLIQFMTPYGVTWLQSLTHWGRVTHICVSILTIIGSDNGLLLGWHLAIIRTNAGILLIKHLRTKFSEILIEIQTFSFKKMHLKTSAEGHPFLFCLGLNVLTLLCMDQDNDNTKHETFKSFSLNGIIRIFIFSFTIIIGKDIGLVPNMELKICYAYFFQHIWLSAKM